LPIDFGGTIEKELPALTSPIVGKVEPFLRIPESLSALEAPPSDEVLASIRKKLDGRRRDRTRIRFFQMAAGVLTILLIAAVIAAGFAWIKQREAIANELRALAALSKATLPTNPTLATKLALAAWPRSGAEWRPKVKEAVEALSAAVVDLRERKILRGDDGNVLSAALSPDGAHVVTASAHTARLWDTKTGVSIVLSGHTDLVRSVAFSPDGARVVTASFDDTARLWDAATGKEIPVIDSKDDKVLSFALLPEGAHVLRARIDERFGRVT